MGMQTMLSFYVMGSSLGFQFQAPDPCSPSIATAWGLLFTLE